MVCRRDQKRWFQRRRLKNTTAEVDGRVLRERHTCVVNGTRHSRASRINVFLLFPASVTNLRRTGFPIVRTCLLFHEQRTTTGSKKRSDLHSWTTFRGDSYGPTHISRSVTSWTSFCIMLLDTYIQCIITGSPLHPANA